MEPMIEQEWEKEHDKWWDELSKEFPGIVRRGGCGRSRVSYLVACRRREGRIGELEASRQILAERGDDWIKRYQRLEADNKTLTEAVGAVIPCLEDWIRTTGFGAVNQRDLHALELCKKALERR